MMITLYTFGPNFGLPDPSPFVMKMEVLLKMAGLPYTCDTNGFFKAPKGKLPYIRDTDGTVVADSDLIRHYLEEKYKIDFDKNMTPEQKGMACAVERLCAEHLYFIVLNERWMNPENFDKGPRQFFSKVPALIRPLIIKSTLRKQKNILWGQGITRHTPAEIGKITTRSIQALNDILGQKPYLGGESPCGADASLYAFLEGILCPYFNTPSRKIMQKFPSLIAYRDRMRHLYYSDFFKSSAQAA